MMPLRGNGAMAFDRWVLRRTGVSLVTAQYALAGGYGYTSTLLLTTVGARSGILREAALPYVVRGDELVVVASKGGGPINPGWVANVRAHPLCWVTLQRRTRPMQARIADDAEWEELFPYLDARRPNVAAYHRRASTFGRRIPFVILSPLTAADNRD